MITQLTYTKTTESKTTEIVSCGINAGRKYEPDRGLIENNGKASCNQYKQERGTEKREVPQAELCSKAMMDVYGWKVDRQVSLLSAEKIDDFRARGAQIDNGAFGENLIISGFDLGNLPLGTRFCIGDTILEMTQIGKQCHSHCAIYKRMGECIMPKGGCVCGSRKRWSDSCRVTR